VRVRFVPVLPLYRCEEEGADPRGGFLAVETFWFFAGFPVQPLALRGHEVCRGEQLFSTSEREVSHRRGDDAGEQLLEFVLLALAAQQRLELARRQSPELIFGEMQVNLSDRPVAEPSFFGCERLRS
jgi:hypothetical protein